MFVRPSSVVLLAALGCDQAAGPPLTRLTQAWAADTAEHAADSMTASLLLGALSSEICVQWAQGTAEEPVSGSPFLLSEPLSWALGEPVVHSVELDSEQWSQMVLSGINLMGLSDQWLRIQITEQDGDLTFDFAPLLDDNDVVDEPARLVGFGQSSLIVQSECMAQQTMVTGTALWIDTNNQRHELKLPADQELGSDIVFTEGLPWVPLSGGISWEARIDSQRRSITTEDADELRMNSAGVGRWPVMVHGPDWSGSALVTIAP